MDLCEFKASLVYRASSRTAKAAQRSPVSKNKKKKATAFICSLISAAVLQQHSEKNNKRPAGEKTMPDLQNSDSQTAGGF